MSCGDIDPRETSWTTLFQCLWNPQDWWISDLSVCLKGALEHRYSSVLYLSIAYVLTSGVPYLKEHLVTSLGIQLNCRPGQLRT